MSGYSNCKNIDRIVRGLVRDGWMYSHNTHPRVTAPSGQFITFSLTPGDHNAHRAFERDIRRLKITINKSLKENHAQSN